MISEVAKIRTQMAVFPTAHEHITHIMLSNRSIEPRENVVDNIEAGRRTYVVPGSGRNLAVIVTDCPKCAAHPYLRTIGNSLLHLGRF